MPVLFIHLLRSAGMGNGAPLPVALAGEDARITSQAQGQASKLAHATHQQKDTGLFQHPVGDEHRFLPLGQNFLEFFAGGFEVGAGLGAGFAKGSELGLDVVG